MTMTNVKSYHSKQVKIGSRASSVFLIMVAVTIFINTEDVFCQKVIQEVLIENRFNFGEGLSFNGEGRLFVCANRSVWEVTTDSQVRKVADFASNLGMAPIGNRDLLKADFGPLTFPQNGPNNDGIVWRVTPEGDTTRVADGIGDPNAIVVLPDNSFLVSDDFTPNIYHVTTKGVVSIFTDAIPFPNGLALSPEGNALYVARIFTKAPNEPAPARFQHFSDEVWRLPLQNYKPAGQPEIIFRTGGETGPDGLAVDIQGRIYLTAARAGQLWRIDPTTGKGELLAEGLPGLASIAFGQGAFDHESLYAMQIQGGRVLRFKVGARGAPLYR